MFTTKLLSKVRLAHYNWQITKINNQNWTKKPGTSRKTSERIIPGNDARTGALTQFSLLWSDIKPPKFYDLVEELVVHFINYDGLVCCQNPWETPHPVVSTTRQN